MVFPRYIHFLKQNLELNKKLCFHNFTWDKQKQIVTTVSRKRQLLANFFQNIQLIYILVQMLTIAVNSDLMISNIESVFYTSVQFTSLVLKYDSKIDQILVQLVNYIIKKDVKQGKKHI